MPDFRLKLPRSRLFQAESTESGLKSAEIAQFQGEIGQTCLKAARLPATLPEFTLQMRARDGKVKLAAHLECVGDGERAGGGGDSVLSVRFVAQGEKTVILLKKGGHFAAPPTTPRPERG